MRRAGLTSAKIRKQVAKIEKKKVLTRIRRICYSRQYKSTFREQKFTLPIGRNRRHVTVTTANRFALFWSFR